MNEHHIIDRTIDQKLGKKYSEINPNYTTELLIIYNSSPSKLACMGGWQKETIV